MKKTFLLVLISIAILLTACVNDKNKKPENVEQNTITEENLISPESEEVIDNVKHLTFSLPEDFSNIPYSEPELTPVENFEWGKYMPFIKYSTDELDDPLPVYAVLGEGITTLKEGHRAYEKLNLLYITQYPILEGYYYGQIPLNKESVSDYLFGSNIVNTTENLEKVEVWRVVDWNKDSVHGELDTYEKGKLISTDIWDRWYYYISDDYKMSNLHGITVTNNWEYTDSSKENMSFIFEVSDKEIEQYEVTFDFPHTYRVILDQIVDSSQLLFTFLYLGWLEDDYVYDPINYDNGINRNTYLLNLESGNLTKVENYVANPLLSPDGNYLIYSSFNDRNASANPTDNPAYVMKTGFFVKNISKNETTFFPFTTSWNPVHDTISWISKEAYDNAVN